MDRALVVIKDRLLNDVTLKNRTALSPEEITKSLELCLKCTYFSSEDQYKLKIHDAAMGSPGSPIVCKLYMEYFERRAL